MRNGNYRIIFRQLLELDTTLLHRRKDRWRRRKQPLAMALDEGGGGRADRDNKINRPIGVEGAKIFYKCSFEFSSSCRALTSEWSRKSTGFSQRRLISDRMVCS